MRILSVLPLLVALPPLGCTGSPETPALPPAKLDEAGGVLKGGRVPLAVSQSIPLVALLVTLMSLSSCTGTSHNSFLGGAYDGPTAAYGYNLP
jgi:hypothetical protein